MAIKIENDELKLSICIDGELTIYTVDEYKTALLDRFCADKLVEIDLQHIDEIDASGLQLLVAMNKELFNNGREMVITAASSEVDEILELTRLLPNKNSSTDVTEIGIES